MITKKRDSIKEQEIQDYANTLISIVKEGYKKGNAIHKVEKDLFKKLLEMGHKALGLLIELCGSGDVGPRVCLDEEREVKRLSAPRVKPYLSIFGSFEISRYVYGRREGQKIEYTPLDAHLQLPRSKFSYLLQDWDQSLAVETPYLRVNETLERIFGLRVPVHSLERGNPRPIPFNSIILGSSSGNTGCRRRTNCGLQRRLQRGCYPEKPGGTSRISA